MDNWLFYGSALFAGIVVGILMIWRTETRVPAKNRENSSALATKDRTPARNGKSDLSITGIHEETDPFGADDKAMREFYIIVRNVGSRTIEICCQIVDLRGDNNIKRAYLPTNLLPRHSKPSIYEENVLILPGADIHFALAFLDERDPTQEIALEYQRIDIPNLIVASEHYKMTVKVFGDCWPISADYEMFVNASGRLCVHRQSDHPQSPPQGVPQ